MVDFNLNPQGIPPAPTNLGGAPVPVVPPPPKRALPKWIIFVPIVLVVVLVLFFVIRGLLSNIGIGSGEITWWGLWEDSSVVAPLISEYEKSHSNVKIKYVVQSKEDYRERLTNAFAKGAGPDIFRFHNSWVPMFKKDLDTLPPNIMSAADFAKTFYPIASSDLTNGTSMVGIPLEYDGLALFVNDDVFAAAGKSPPVTWDDLRQAALDLTKKDDAGNIIQAGVALGRTENVDHWPEILGLMMLQNGVNLTKPVGKPAEDALKFFTVFSLQDRVWDATLPSSTVAFAGGKVAMYFGPSWRAFEIRQQNPNLKFRTVPVPQLPKASPNERNVNYASYWAEGVWAKSKNKAAAWDFLKFLSSKESLEKMYTNASQTRAFGEPYPRVDMGSLLTTDTTLGSIISGAPDAETWYLQSRTFDGPTGINSQVNKYFEDAVNAVNAGTAPTQALETASQGISQVLSQYGIVTP